MSNATLYRKITGTVLQELTRHYNIKQFGEYVSITWSHAISRRRYLITVITVFVTYANDQANARPSGCDVTYDLALNNCLNLIARRAVTFVRSEKPKIQTDGTRERNPARYQRHIDLSSVSDGRTPNPDCPVVVQAIERFSFE